MEKKKRENKGRDEDVKCMCMHACMRVNDSVDESVGTRKERRGVIKVFQR